MSQTVLADPSSRWDRFEALLSKASERLNPILIKEARQALRSKQFVGTFLLALVAGWAWSIFGLTYIGSEIADSEFGPTMFFGFFLILSVPALVIAPYSAFQSLSSERQDRTFELVSITSLGARQILAGKLCSVVLQLAVFYSAIGPCLAFTYLLRGLDVVTMVMSLVYLTFLSLGLAVLGLLFAALNPLRVRTIITGILYAMALFGCMIGLSALVSSLVFGGVAWTSEGMLTVHLVLLTIYFNLFALAFLAARATLMSENQNRSTALRVATVVAQLCFVAWIAYAQFFEAGDITYFFLLMSAVFWYYAGIHFTSESAQLSSRVRRDLPQSVLGRIFLTCFYPGPGSGFVFVIANMLATSAAAMFFSRVSFQSFTGAPVRTGRQLNIAEIAATAIIITSYLVIYLGLGKLIMGWLRKRGEVKPQLRVTLYHLLVLFGSAVPWAIQAGWPDAPSGYTLMQITNPVWTIYELCRPGLPFHLVTLMLAVPSAAIVIWLVNLPGMASEFRLQRMDKPKRMVEEDHELELQMAGPPKPTSPWG